MESVNLAFIINTQDSVAVYKSVKSTRKVFTVYMKPMCIFFVLKPQQNLIL